MTNNEKAQIPPLPVLRCGRCELEIPRTELGAALGFSLEDVDLIRSWTAGLMSKSYGGKGGPEAQRLDSLADRIAALFPSR